LIFLRLKLPCLFSFEFQVFLLSSAVLGLGSAYPRADFGSDEHHHDHHHDAAEKVCTLERSATKVKNDCFLEPECQNNCQDVTRTVKIKLIHNKPVKIISILGL
jgi:hypothetical protein